MQGVGSPDEELLWRGQYQCACPPQYTFSDEYEVPQPVSDVSGKARGQVTRVGMCVRNFPYSAVKHRMKLGQGPKRRIDRVRIPDELADAGGFRFIEVELRYIGRVEIQDYRPRSSSMILVLSLTRGIRSQTLCMDAKIRAFFAAAMRRGEVTGRNSATGSPRLSITITPPSAASRTSFDVLMCRSRTDVDLIMLHCST